jgi:pilus assembly protein Flp/PilA
MKFMIQNIFANVQNFLTEEEGQDLVEYALVVALIALAATTGMSSLATKLSAAFTSIGTTVAADV